MPLLLLSKRDKTPARGMRYLHGSRRGVAGLRARSRVRKNAVT